MCAYLSKCEDECPQTMNQAVKEAFEHNLDNYQQIKSVAHMLIKKNVAFKSVYSNLSWPLVA